MIRNTEDAEGMNDVIEIRVFVGGENCVQLRPFDDALNLIQRRRPTKPFVVTRLFNKDIPFEWGPKELVDWLLVCDFHFILTHIHQGSNLKWNCRQLYNVELKRLAGHQGFPYGLFLTCPVKTQNKWEYIKLLGSDAIPTLYFSIPCASYELIDLSDVMNLWEESQRTEGRGLVIKLPFVTDSKQGDGIYFSKTLHELRRDLEKAARAALERGIWYLMLQTCLSNQKEYKVVLRGFKGSANSIAANPHHHRGERKFSTARELKEFAEKAISTLAKNHRGAIVEGLNRVDIMQMKSGKLVVNEIEGFEALYVKKGSRTSDETENNLTHKHMIEFWASILGHFLYKT